MPRNLRLPQQNYAPSLNQLPAPYRSNSLASLRFKVHPLRIKPQDFRDPSNNRRLMYGQYWPLGRHHAVDIHDPPARAGHPLVGKTQHLRRVSPPIRLLRIRKKLPNIGQPGSPQHGVGHRMQQHIRVAVANCMPIVRHIDAA